ncbi:transporter substrate-binding domain-containing protein [Mesorhizobium sp. PUT5]|uniref:transporter substrate-binding domain-containing protein n=1 Tax=Mesorhizobium sp. PUT5 TaxID=3454629 RepID=UPI003FA436D9
MFRVVQNFKRALKAVALACCVVGASSPAFADLQDILASGKVRIGVPLDVPPFGFVDENQQPVGLDVDVAHMVADALGVELELQQLTGANRIPFLLTDKIDIIVSGLGATPERAKQVAFSAPYSTIYIGVFGPKDIDVKSADEITTQTVGVQRGSSSDLVLTELLDPARIKRFEDDATLNAAYIAKQIDLIGTASIILKHVAKQNPGLDVDTKFVIRHSPPHMAVRYGNPDLLRWLDTFVFYNLVNGELNRLAVKWLDEPLPEPFPNL